MTGIVGRMFREFALTLTHRGGRLGRDLVDPDAHDVRAAAAPGCRPTGQAHALGRAADGRDGARLRAHASAWALRHRALMILLTLVHPRAHDAALYGRAEGFSPPQDTGLLVVVIEAAPDASFAEMARLQDEASDVFRADPDVAGVVVGGRGRPAEPDAQYGAPHDHPAARDERTERASRNRSSG